MRNLSASRRRCAESVGATVSFFMWSQCTRLRLDSGQRPGCEDREPPLMLAALASWVRPADRPLGLKRAQDLCLQVDDFHTMERLLACILQRGAHKPTTTIENQMPIVEHVSTPDFDLKALLLEIAQRGVEAGL